MYVYCIFIDTIIFLKFFDRYFLGNETIYGIKNTHIQQNRTDQPWG